MNEETREGEEDPVRVVLQRDAYEPQAEGIDEQCREPQRVQPELGPPDALVSGAEPQGEAVGEKVAVELDGDYGQPVDRRDYTLLVSTSPRTRPLE